MHRVGQAGLDPHLPRSGGLWNPGCTGRALARVSGASVTSGAWDIGRTTTQDILAPLKASRDQRQIALNSFRERCLSRIYSTQGAPHGRPLVTGKSSSNVQSMLTLIICDVDTGACSWNRVCEFAARHVTSDVSR